jgi:hypothetical protein
MTDRSKTLNGAAAGAAAAFVWAATEPLDKPIFGCRYSDVEFLGKGVTRGPAWRIIGFAMHLANGALFGAIYANSKHRLSGSPAARGLAAGMIEHLLSWPATAIADRVHPARDELVSLSGNKAAFAQATWRHALFGATLGVVEGALNPEEDLSANSEEPDPSGSIPPATS